MLRPSFYSIFDSFVLDSSGNIGIGTAYPKTVIDIANRTDAIIIPSQYVVTTETVTESSNVPKVGVLRMNKAYGRFEKKMGANWVQTSIWQPVIVSATPTKLQNVGMQTTVDGTLFEINSVWSFVGNDGTNYPCISQYVNQTRVILTRPDIFPVSKSPYRIRVYNSEAAKEYVSSTLLIDAGVGPTFTTAAGSLSNLVPNTAYNPGIVIIATDELFGGISNISIDSALIGSGLSATFSNSSLMIGGTTSNVSSLVTFNFTSTAMDLGGNAATRAYSFTLGNLSLYSFSSHTFTNAGQTSRTGPTLAQCRAAYSSASWAQNTTNNYLNMVTQGIQEWTVPKSGLYNMTVAGSIGGTSYVTKGSGVVLNFTNVSLISGDKLYIVVGQNGVNSGGGGASWVFYNNRSTLWFVAGGGGGGATNSYNGPGSSRTPGLNGTVATTGNDGRSDNSNTRAGGLKGTNGSGGQGASGGNGSGSAGGSGIGGASSTSNWNTGGGGGGSSGVATSTFLGGDGPRPGGFGGGGAGGGSDWGTGGGGGGGYNGGGAGAGGNSNNDAGGGGGGGGSYYIISPSSTAFNASVGYVTITAV